jgi:(E)-4-hydroxy-3-methylbut-2-enyl-diphosphate synthase
MTKTDTHDIEATLKQIRELEEVGCEIVRIAVPDKEAIKALTTIKKESPLPIIADIHFDYRLALGALEAGVDGLRLNPGNISEPDKVTIIARESAQRNVPIRIGVNAGSLPQNFKPELPLSERLVEKALEQIRILEDLGFDLIKVSLKAFDVPTTVAAYRSIASRMPYPLHIGITEAGPPPNGLIRSSVGLGILLNEGLGDTIRVSLTAHPREEVTAAYEILKSLNLREHGPILVSCPVCGRAEVDIAAIAREVEKVLLKIEKPIRVAVMGCVVNGPGEAKEADIGLACGKGRAVIFKKGTKLRVVEEEDILSVLVNEINAFSA